MMKKILVLILCVLVYSALFAQSNEDKKTVFQLSFVPPLSTNGAYSYQYTNTVSLNLLVGVSRNEEAFTWGGISNIILNDAKGFQMAGLSNYVGNDGQGVQSAGLANVNKNKFSGFQMAGLANTASEMTGFQFAGLVNIAKEVNGLQIAGLVNIAKEVNGIQFAGLVNIADKSDCPIGLINIIKNGEMGVAVTYDALGSTIATFRSGGRYTYGIIGVGYNHKTENSSLVAEGGFGAHIPVTSWFRINNELKASTIGNDSDEPVLNTGYSLIPSFSPLMQSKNPLPLHRVQERIELFGGVGINYMMTKDVSNSKIFPNHSLWKKAESTKLQQLYIGYQFGIQYIF